MKRLPLIITAVSLPVWIILGYLLYDSLSSQIAYNEAIKLSEKKAAQKLTVIHITENTTKELIDTLELCEMARFAPISVSAQEIYNKAENSINKIEEEAKS